MITIKQLRQSGYKVRVFHKRNYDSIEKIGGISKQVAPKGGETYIEITTPCKTFTEEGLSICSDQDLFNRRTGNEIAMGRAIKALKSKGYMVSFY